MALGVCYTAAVLTYVLVFNDNFQGGLARRLV